jgi:hypothetical protein
MGPQAPPSPPPPGTHMRGLYENAEQRHVRRAELEGWVEEALALRGRGRWVRELADGDGRTQRGRECAGDAGCLRGNGARARAQELTFAMLCLDEGSNATTTPAARLKLSTDIAVISMTMTSHLASTASGAPCRADVARYRRGAPWRAMPELPFRLLGRTKLPLSAGDRTPELMMSPQQATCAEHFGASVRAHERHSPSGLSTTLARGS